MIKLQYSHMCGFLEPNWIHFCARNTYARKCRFLERQIGPADVIPSAVKACVIIIENSPSTALVKYSALIFVLRCVKDMPAGFAGVYSYIKCLPISDNWWAIERDRQSVTFENFLDSFMQKCEIKKLY